MTPETMAKGGGGISRGTLSILIGAHQFLIHPLFVAAAWTRLYGLPRDPRLWVAFAVHDLGYWGCPDMDSPEGERHVEFGARIMAKMFDRQGAVEDGTIVLTPQGPDRRAGRRGFAFSDETVLGDWGRLCLFHSRFYSRRLDLPVSRLCAADKLAMSLEPAFLYLPRVLASGEAWEYLSEFCHGKYAKDMEAYRLGLDLTPQEIASRRLTRRTWHGLRTWHAYTRKFLRGWAFANAEAAQ